MPDSQAVEDRRQLHVLAEQITNWAAQLGSAGTARKCQEMREVASDVRRQLTESEARHSAEEKFRSLGERVA